MDNPFGNPEETYKGMSRDTLLRTLARDYLLTIEEVEDVFTRLGHHFQGPDGQYTVDYIRRERGRRGQRI